MSPLKVAEQFVAAINAHDVTHIASLMTADHRFIDSLGDVVEGRDTMRERWKVYFGMVPGYKLDIRHRFVTEDGTRVVMLAGKASGSYHSKGLRRPNSLWSTPVALRAVVRGGHVAEWQVYADNEPIRQLMGIADA